MGSSQFNSSRLVTGTITISSCRDRIVILPCRCCTNAWFVARCCFIPSGNTGTYIGETWREGERGLSSAYLARGRSRVLFVLFIRPTGIARVIIESGLLDGRDYTSLSRLTHRKWRGCKRCRVADRTVELWPLLREFSEEMRLRRTHQELHSPRQSYVITDREGSCKSYWYRPYILVYRPRNWMKKRTFYSRVPLKSYALMNFLFGLFLSCRKSDLWEKITILIYS